MLRYFLINQEYIQGPIDLYNYLFKTEPIVTLFGSELSSLVFALSAEVSRNALLVPEKLLSNPFISSVSVSLSNDEVGFFLRCSFVFFFYIKIIRVGFY